MKIYVEAPIHEIEEPQSNCRNIVDVFDIKAIQHELEKHGIKADINPKRKINDKLWAMYIVVPFNGLRSHQVEGPNTARVALMVNFDNNTAFAIPRDGSDKQIMLLISTIANKHIKQPFKYDRNIRNQI